MRTADAIREMDEIFLPPCDGYDFSELAPDDVLNVLPLENMLNKGYVESPFFMFREKVNENEFLKNYEHYQSTYFIAKHAGHIVAFIRAEVDGENFICGTQGYLHIKGAFCLPEHRCTGVSQKLLGLLVKKLKEEGYMRLGVDYESINPSGARFWQKHFSPYTCGVVRRIDEYALAKGS